MTLYPWTQARNIADGNPHSFLRVSRAEIELASDVDPYSEAVYQRGADNLHTLIANNILIWEEQPLLGIYRQRQGTHPTNRPRGACVDR